MYRHFKRLNEFYEVSLYKGSLDKKTEELKMLQLFEDDVIVRIFPTEQDDEEKDTLGIGMFVTKNSPNDIKINIPDIFEYIPDIDN